MPLTLADFLAREPELVRLRQQIAARIIRRPGRAVAQLVELLTSRWQNGVAGWLTAAEGDRLAEDLNAKAELLGLAAQADAEDDDDGRFWLVFWGGRYGDQRLLLARTGPIAAAQAWDVYLSTCPRLRLRLLAGGRR